MTVHVAICPQPEWICVVLPHPRISW